MWYNEMDYEIFIENQPPKIKHTAKKKKINQSKK